MKKFILFLLLYLIINQTDLVCAWIQTNIANNSNKTIHTYKNINENTQEKLQEIEKRHQEPAGFVNSFTKSNNIVIEWEDSTADSYNIYRNTSKISNQNILRKAILIGNVRKGQQAYVDTNIPSDGNYYYAIINVNNTKEHVIFIPDSNFTTIPVIFSKPKIKSEPIPESPKIPKLEVKKEPSPEEIPKKVVQKPKIIKKKIEKKPIKKNHRINYDLYLNNIVKKYFLKKDYQKTIDELNKIIKTKASNKIKMKAKLFLGRTYYELGNYNKALKLFIESKEVYSDESDFWIRKTLKNIK